MFGTFTGVLTGFEPYSRATTVLKISAAFAIASAAVFIRGWAIAYFELTGKTPQPTAEELATFRGHALTAVALMGGGLLVSLWIGRLEHLGWGKALGLALLGIPVGLAITLAAIPAFFILT